MSTKFTQPKMATFEDLLTNRRHHDLNFFVSGAKAARRTASSPASPPSNPRIASLRNTYHRPLSFRVGSPPRRRVSYALE